MRIDMTPRSILLIVAVALFLPGEVFLPIHAARIG